ncbi:MAG: hypothetical protein E6J12_09800 [Chloroflexi bacterium]|nr:MAG: hypothetical protein E6J12_09800 [Chloroflexota bacterium]TME92805.1 MAG: hypothetical protein E6I34_07625 [Chloroflexota bacterium]
MRERAMTPRRLLQESDELLYWVEECMVQERRIVPGWLVSRLMVVLRHAHPDLPARLGRERRPNQVMEIIYDAQAALMDQACRSRGPAEVIPLFSRARAVRQRLGEAATV